MIDKSLKPTVVAIVGMAGSGKTIICQYFAKKGYPVLRFGDLTDKGLTEKGLPINPDDERAFREELRKSLGMAAYAIKIEPQIKKALKNSPLVILDGLYSWEEYVYLKQKLSKLILLAIYASPKIRYQRLSLRKVRPLTPEQAKKRDMAELKALNKGGPIAMADYLIKNNQDQQTLYTQLDKVFDGIQKK